MKYIYLIRHGETESNRKGIFRGRLDIPLSEEGMKQSESLKTFFKNKKIEIIYSSPLSRAYKTAEICFKGEKIVKEGLLNNLDLGQWSGVEKEKIKKELPEDWSEWTNHPEAMKFPQGESIGDVYKRAVRFLHRIAQSKENKIAAISHRSVIKTILSAAVGLKDNYFWKFHLDNTSVSTLLFEKNRGFTIYKTNDTSHLKKFITEWF